MRLTSLAVALMFILLFPGLAMSQEDNQQQKSVEDASFEKSLEQQLPMSPKQIKKFKDRMNETQESVNKQTPPSMSSRTRELSFDTGDAPPVVKIASGYVTTLSFFDATGQPWPLTNVVVGNSEYFEVNRPEGEENTITVTAKKNHIDSNLSLTFEDQNMPATVQLRTVSEGEDDTDSIIAFRAEGRGPKAKEATVGPGIDNTIDEIMMGFLDYAPPDSATYRALEPDVSGVDLWAYEDSFYLRTEYPLVWPAWTSVTKGPGDVRVYELPEVSSILVSKDGKSTDINVRRGMDE